MSEIKRAVELAKILIEARARVAEAELDLKSLEACVRKLEQEDLPELMRELELTSFKLDTGETVNVVEDITCGITDATRQEAHAWLVAHEFGAVIKTEVKVAFPAGSLQEAGEFAANNGGSLKEFVHPQTLKSLLREQLEAGAAIPLEAFGIRSFNKVKIDLPKSKVGRAEPR